MQMISVDHSGYSVVRKAISQEHLSQTLSNQEKLSSKVWSDRGAEAFGSSGDDGVLHSSFFDSLKSCCCPTSDRSEWHPFTDR
jgi:hypothetical protein